MSVVFDVSSTVVIPGLLTADVEVEDVLVVTAEVCTSSAGGGGHASSVGDGGLAHSVGMHASSVGGAGNASSVGGSGVSSGDDPRVLEALSRVVFSGVVAAIIIPLKSSASSSEAVVFTASESTSAVLVFVAITISF